MKIVTDASIGYYSPNTQRVTIETDNSSFELPIGSNLLDALLATGHQVDYQCRGGYCGSCRINVVHGNVDYDEQPLAHINDDEILPCLCKVKESLKLDISRAEADSTQGSLLD